MIFNPADRPRVLLLGRILTLLVLLQFAGYIKADNRHDDSNKHKKQGISKEEPAMQSLPRARQLEAPHEAEENESGTQHEQEITKRHYRLPPTVWPYAIIPLGPVAQGQSKRLIIVGLMVRIHPGPPQ